MKTAILGLTLAFAATFPQPMTAQGLQQACGDRNAIVERLEAKWGESFAGGGLQNASSMFEVWMSAEKGTWTILRTHANGMACVMASGTNWLVGLPPDQTAGIKG